jgi:hypothetical protein
MTELPQEKLCALVISLQFSFEGIEEEHFSENELKSRVIPVLIKSNNIDFEHMNRNVGFIDGLKTSADKELPMNSAGEEMIECIDLVKTWSFNLSQELIEILICWTLQFSNDPIQA